MKWNEANEAIRDAEITIRQADNRVRDMARIIKGKLRACNISYDVLCELKKELRGYNMCTGLWKD